MSELHNTPLKKLARDSAITEFDKQYFAEPPAAPVPEKQEAETVCEYCELPIRAVYLDGGAYWNIVNSSIYVACLKNRDGHIPRRTPSPDTQAPAAPVQETQETAVPVEMTHEQKADEYDMLEFDRNHILSVLREKNDEIASLRAALADAEREGRAEMEEIALRTIRGYPDCVGNTNIYEAVHEIMQTVRKLCR